MFLAIYATLRWFVLPGTFEHRSSTALGSFLNASVTIIHYRMNCFQPQELSWPQKFWEQGSEGLGARLRRSGSEAQRVWERGSEGLGARLRGSGSEAQRVRERGSEGPGARLRGSGSEAQKGV